MESAGEDHVGVHEERLLQVVRQDDDNTVGPSAPGMLRGSAERGIDGARAAVGEQERSACSHDVAPELAAVCFLRGHRHLPGEATHLLHRGEPQCHGGAIVAVKGGCHEVSGAMQAPRMLEGEWVGGGGGGVGGDAATPEGGDALAPPEQTTAKAPARGAKVGRGDDGASVGFEAGAPVGETEQQQRPGAVQQQGPRVGSEGAAGFQIFAACGAAGTVALRVSGCTTIADIRRMACELTGLPSEMVRLAYGTRHPGDGETAASAGIRKEATVKVLGLGLLGGTGSPIPGKRSREESEEADPSRTSPREYQMSDQGANALLNKEMDIDQDGSGTENATPHRGYSTAGFQLPTVGESKHVAIFVGVERESISDGFAVSLDQVCASVSHSAGHLYFYDWMDCETNGFLPHPIEEHAQLFQDAILELRTKFKRFFQTKEEYRGLKAIGWMKASGENPELKAKKSKSMVKVGDDDDKGTLVIQLGEKSFRSEQAQVWRLSSASSTTTRLRLGKDPTFEEDPAIVYTIRNGNDLEGALIFLRLDEEIHGYLESVKNRIEESVQEAVRPNTVEVAVTINVFVDGSKEPVTLKESNEIRLPEKVGDVKVGDVLQDLIKERVEIEFSGVTVDKDRIIPITLPEELMVLDGAPSSFSVLNGRTSFPKEMEMEVNVTFDQPPASGQPGQPPPCAKVLEKENVKKGQREVAKRLLGRVKHLLQDNFETFTSVNFLVLVPTFNSLVDQTKHRIQNDVSGYDFEALREELKSIGRDKKEYSKVKGQLSKVMASRVFSYIKGKNQERDFEAFVTECESKDTELFVIVADECHWGVNNTGAHHHFVNNKRLLPRSNYLALLVSATPYNVLTKHSRIPDCRVKIDADGEVTGDGDSSDENLEKLNVVHWFKPGQRGTTPYRGLEWYLSTLPSDLRKDGRSEELGIHPLGRIRSDEFVSKIKNEGNPKVNLVNECALMADYAFSMAFFSIYRKEGGDGYAFPDPLCALADSDMKADQAVKFVKLLWRLPRDMTGAASITTRSTSQVQDWLKEALKTRFMGHVEKSLGATAVKEGHFYNDWGNFEAPLSIAEQWRETLSKLRESIQPMWPRDRDGKGPPGLGSETDAGKGPPGLGSETDAGKGPPGLGSETDAIIADLLDKNTRPDGLGSMKIIRVYSGLGGQFTRDMLLYLRKELLGDALYEQETGSGLKFPPFAILEDFGTEKTTSCLKFDKKFNHDEFRLELPGQPDPETIHARSSRREKEGNKLQYEDLNGLPCILVLVDKGRMGDTFPKSMDCLDLRIRASDTTSTFVQELGRLCRYPVTVPCRSGSRLIQAVPWENYQPEEASKLEHVPVICTFEVTSNGEPIFRQDSRRKEKGDLEDLMKPCNLGRDHPANGRGDSVAVMSGGGLDEIDEGGEHDFIGYADHWEEWAVGKAIPSVVCSGKGSKTNDAREFSLNVWKGDPPSKHDLLALKMDDESNVMTYIKVIDVHKAAADSDKTLIRLDDDISASTEVSFVLLRDSSSLLALCRMCPHGGSVHRVSDKMPYVLVPQESLGKIVKGIKTYDAELLDVKGDPTHLEILSFISFGQVDHYVLRGKSARDHDYSKHSASTTKGTISYDKDNQLKHKRRLLLFAECQIGKTGAYCHFLTMLKREIQDNAVIQLPEQPLELDVCLKRDPDEQQFPGPVEWALPYWEKIQKGFAVSWKSDVLIAPLRGKYHPKMRLLRFSILLKACKKGEGGTDGDWWHRFKQFVAEEGLATSKARDAALKKLELAPQCKPPLTIIDGHGDDCTKFTVDDRDLVARVIDWDIAQKDLETSSIWRSTQSEDKFLFPNKIWRDDSGSSNNTYKMDESPEGTLQGVQKACWSGIGAGNELVGNKIGETGTSERVRIDTMPGFIATRNPSPKSSGDGGGSMYYLCHESVGKVFNSARDVFKKRGTQQNNAVAMWIPDIYKPFFVIDGNLVKGAVSGKTEGGKNVCVLWTFTPSYGRHGAGSQRAGLLNRRLACPRSLEKNSDAPTKGWSQVKLVQVLVVRQQHDEGQQEFSEYRQMWGGDYVIIQMPDTIECQWLKEERTPKVEHGIGYTRLATQLIAHSLGLKRIWMLDDNIQFCMKLDLEQVEKKMSEHGGDLSKAAHKKILTESMTSCTFLDVMISIEQQVLGNETDTEFPVSLDKAWSLSNLGLEKFKKCKHSSSERFSPKLYAEHDDRGSIESRVDFSGKLSKLFAVVGMNRDMRNVYKMTSTFNLTPSVYSFYLLNVEETVNRRVFYPSINAWEDIEFNQMCREKGMVVLKCASLLHKKDNLQPTSGLKVVSPELKIQVLVENLDEATNDCVVRGDDWDNNTQEPGVYLNALVDWMKNREIEVKDVLVFPEYALDDIEDFADQTNAIDRLWKETICGGECEYWNKPKCTAKVAAQRPLVCCCFKNFAFDPASQVDEVKLDSVFDFLAWGRFLNDRKMEIYIIIPTRLFRSPKQDETEDTPISYLKKKWQEKQGKIDRSRYDVLCKIWAPLLPGSRKTISINPSGERQDPSMLVVHIEITPNAQSGSKPESTSPVVLQSPFKFPLPSRPSPSPSVPSSEPSSGQKRKHPEAVPDREAAPPAEGGGAVGKKVKKKPPRPVQDGETFETGKMIALLINGNGNERMVAEGCKVKFTPAKQDDYWKSKDPDNEKKGDDKKLKVYGVFKGQNPVKLVFSGCEYGEDRSEDPDSFSCEWKSTTSLKDFKNKAFKRLEEMYPGYSRPPKGSDKSIVQRTFACEKKPGSNIFTSLKTLMNSTEFKELEIRHFHSGLKAQSPMISRSEISSIPAVGTSSSAAAPHVSESAGAPEESSDDEALPPAPQNSLAAPSD